MRTLLIALAITVAIAVIQYRPAQVQAAASLGAAKPAFVVLSTVATAATVCTTRGELRQKRTGGTTKAKLLFCAYTTAGGAGGTWREITVD